MNPLEAFGLWKWIEENGAAFEPPVGNKVIWEDSQFTAMVIRGPNARRDFHIDPSDEIFFSLFDQGRKMPLARNTPQNVATNAPAMPSPTSSGCDSLLIVAVRPNTAPMIPNVGA